ncbi:MAG TPA: glycine--tRNA ligase subunit beta [Usitatibacter sp.]|nr:glycine--tRNA ligase subunit beta [Usitatibacter sp.]
MTATLLVELLTEELPPKALKRLGDAFAESLAKGLAKREMTEAGAEPRAFATPRRLAVAIPHVKAQSEPRAVEVKLMPVAVALDANGQPTPALRKKLEAAGLGNADPAGLRRKLDGKTEMLFADARTPAVPLAQALQAALEEAVSSLPIPKVMSYQLEDGVTTVQFVRPVHGIVALHGKDVVPVSLLGLRAGRETRGHRFQGASQFPIASADEYESRLREEGGVMASFTARRDEIRRQLEENAARVHASLGAVSAYEALLDEVTALVEMPTVYAGTFEPEFLSVPAECLVLTMRQNQKYFPLFDAGGKLTNRFLIVSNMRLDDPSNIVQGNERVVRPRLADARFFFETDKKVKLADRVPQLRSIVYHNKLGSQLERIERLRKLASRIQETLPRGEKGKPYADRAALLAKADLVTLMVGEFPELQGVMGKYYAEADGEQPSVARAIEQHYWPRFAGDALPTGDASIAVALADRMDTLAGMFSIGQRPTGDKDPFALRRAALGVIRILMETPLAIELQPLIRRALDLFPEVLPDKSEALVSEMWSFMRERLDNLLRERGYTAHEVAAVLEVQSDDSKYDRLDLVPKKLEAVREFRKLPEAESLAAANKRISNILRQATQKGEQYSFVEESSLDEPLERDLYRALRNASSEATPHFERGDYTEYLKSFAVLKAPVDAFFDGVMVMVDEPKVRRKRLGLLSELQWQMNRVADISRLAA